MLVAWCPVAIYGTYRTCLLDKWRSTTLDPLKVERSFVTLYDDLSTITVFDNYSTFQQASNCTLSISHYPHLLISLPIKERHQDNGASASQSTRKRQRSWTCRVTIPVSTCFPSPGEHHQLSFILATRRPGCKIAPPVFSTFIEVQEE